MNSPRLFLMRLRARLGPDSRARAYTVAGFVAAALVVVTYALPLRTAWPNDYYGFWLAGHSARSSGLDNIYSYRGQIKLASDAARGADSAPSKLEQRMRRFYRIMDLTGTPMHYTVFKLLSSGDMQADYDRFRRISIVVYAVAVVAFAAALRYPPWALPVIAWYFTASYWPFRRDVMDANCSSFLAGGVMLSLLLLRSRSARPRFCAGLALGLITLFKPTTVYAVLFIVFVFAITDRRSLAWFAGGAAASAAVGLVLPWMVLGPACNWPDWFNHIQGRSFAMRHVAGGVLGRYFRVTSPVWYQGAAALGLGTCGFFLWRALRRALPKPGGLDAISAAAVGLNAYLLTGVLVWGHYFTLAVPSALLAMRPRQNRPGGAWRERTVALLATLALGLHAQFRHWGWTTWGNYSPFTLGAAAVLAGLVIWDLRAPAGFRPAGTT